jgi:hypothetical protein
VCGKGVPHIRYNNTRSSNIRQEDNTIIGSLAVSVKGGVRGQAFFCDGRGSFDIEHEPKLEPDELTVAVWIRFDRLPAGKDTRRWLVSKNASEWAQGHYGLVIDGRGRAAAYMNIGGGRENCVGLWGREPVLKARTWAHLVLSYNREGMMRLYHNGRMLAERKIGKRRVAGKGPLCIGKRPDGHCFFEGMLDEVYLFDKALAAEEIGRLMSIARQPESELPAALQKAQLGRWDFDDKETDLGEVVAEAQKRAGPEPAYRKSLGLE